MNFTEALAFGGVEGLTEFLPISSTGHMVLVREALAIPSSAFVTTFIIAIQCGAIAAVLVTQGRRLFVERAVLLRVAAAFIPTMILGLVLYRVIRNVLLESPPVVLWSLGIGGIVLILFEVLHGEKKDAVASVPAMSWLQAALVGACQALAFVPGVSRSAATVVGGMALGVRRAAMVEFSFLLAIPTMLAATTLQLWKSADELSASQIDLLLAGFVAAFVVALLAIHALLRFVKSHTFIVFGVYRIAIALVFWWILYLR